MAILLDEQGHLLIADRDNHRIHRVDPNGVISTFAGREVGGQPTDGVLATQSSLFSPTALALDSLGNVLIADTGNHRIRKVERNGTITTVAGDGFLGGSDGASGRFTGEGQLATLASLWAPQGLVVDDLGNVLIADTRNQRIRRLESQAPPASTPT